MSNKDKGHDVDGVDVVGRDPLEYGILHVGRRDSSVRMETVIPFVLGPHGDATRLRLFVTMKQRSGFHETFAVHT
jgi:hypothetical protein